MSATPALAAAPDPSDDQPVETAPANEAADMAPAAAVVEAAEPPSHTELVQPAEQVAVTPALSPADREQAIARIRKSAILPPALRERLATLVESSGDSTAPGQTRLPLEAYLQALEESLPDFLHSSRADAAQPPHPAGDVFFRGSSEELSDAQAEELAQRQVSRSGLLRGQRVRVAD